jgi:RNA polymerase sigma factor (sigma-70 family)
MTPDSQLLQHYARTHSEEAFAELARRHVNFVYSAALRQVGGDAHLAQDVTQTVFFDLARKAASLARRETLAGWLYTSARFAAAKIARTENRRRHHEEKFMREPIDQNAPETEWEKLRPVLDDAMHELKEADRDAILLRYFENRPFAEVGAKLGLQENTARMRVERALEKLRDILGQRGITTTAALASVISTNAVQTAPAGLAAIVVPATGAFTLLKLMTATKLKLALGALVAAGMTTALVMQYHMLQQLRAERELLTQQLAQLKSENDNLSNHAVPIDNSKSLTEEQLHELLKLRGEAGMLRQNVGKLAQAHEKTPSQTASDQNKTIPVSPQEYFKLHRLDLINASKQIGLGMVMYANDHNNQFPTNINEVTTYLNTTNFPGNIGLDVFELVNVGTARLSGQMLMLRESSPRQSPQGKWERVYGMTDGAVQLQSSADGNFDAWEQQFAPPSNP